MDWIIEPDRHPITQSHQKFILYFRVDVTTLFLFGTILVLDFIFILFIFFKYLITMKKKNAKAMGKARKLIAPGLSLEDQILTQYLGNLPFGGH